MVRKVIYVVHCPCCLAVLGVSEVPFAPSEDAVQKEPVFCLKCAREVFK